MVYFYLEDIIANAIIELNGMDGSRKIFISLAQEYGEEVVKKIRENGCYANIKSINERSMLLFEQKYSNFFIPYMDMGIKGYLLREERTIEELVIEFRKKSDLDVWSVFSDKEIVSRILGPYANFTKEKLYNYSKCEEIVEDFNDCFLGNGMTDGEFSSKKKLAKLKSWQKNEDYR